MAQFPKIQLTQLGKNMIIDGQNKKPVAFTKVELGDGLLSGQSVEELTALVHSVMSVPLQNFTNNGDGTAHLRFVLDNNALDKGFFNREIGVYAKVGDGTEQLYAYTNAANLADYIPGKESPITSKIINLHLVIGNTEHISIVAENSAYATKIDIEKHRTAAELDHPDGSVTTPKLRDAAVTGAKIADGVIDKKHLAASIVSMISDAGIAILQRNKTYAVGDIAYHKALPSWARLECVKAGTTGATLPTEIEQMVQNGGVLITDGTAVWIVDDLRDGTPVGAVRGSLYLPAGYIKCNGATVQRADYPRLVALADKHNLWTDDVTANAGLFGRGDGNATFVLPNWTDRMMQLAADSTGVTVAAGLPNITGGINNTFRTISGGGGYGAMVGSVDAGSQGFGSGGAVPSTIVRFDASKSNAIYGASDTVQPAAVKMLPIIRY